MNDSVPDDKAEPAVTAVRFGADNFAYLLRNPAGGGTCVVIDPGGAEAVRRALSRAGLRPELLLATHGHPDHMAGLGELAREAGCPTPRPASGEIAWSGGRLLVLPTPGHTPDHVAFLEPRLGVLFTGDALFVAGCGRIGGRDSESLGRSLRRMAGLPAATLVYPGHDYAAGNLSFAASLDPADATVAERLARARAGDPLVPSTIGEELRINPFLRCADPAYRERIGMAGLSAGACLAELRRRKDAWPE